MRLLFDNFEAPACDRVVAKRARDATSAASLCAATRRLLTPANICGTSILDETYDHHSA
jgi:hypothetical protein